MNFKTLIFLVAISLTSCGDHNEIIVNDEAGNMLEKFIINKDSLKNGLYQSFYSDGTIMESSNYINGVLKTINQFV